VNYGIVVACLLLVPAAASAQTIVPGTLRLPGDSAARADSISRPAGADSAGRTASRDSAGTRSGISAGAGTTGTGTSGSSTGVYIAPSAGTTAPPAPQTVNVTPAPLDTTLARACAGMSAGDEAPGLLVVIFRRGTSDKDRAAAAKAVGGVLAGTSPYGEDYVRLGADAAPLTVMADRLIRQEPVLEVSPTPCPQTAAPVSSPSP
jgi:hypothetical protein